MSQVGAIGIDFGSLRSVLAVAKKGGVDILANEGSHRETSNIIGYGEKQRKIGEQGQQQAQSNFKNTVQFFSRFLGLSKNYTKLKEETKWLTSRLADTESDKFGFEVTLRGEKHIFTPEQVTAAMLTKLRQILRFNELPDKQFVLSVPSYLTESERVCLLEAAKIADVNIIKLFNECSAISLSYGLFRRSELGDQTNPRHVIFLDLGHSKFSAFCASFTKEKAKIVSQIHDRHLGCRDFDWTVLNLYAAEFAQTSGMNIFESKKSVLRLLDAIEKQRKVLSANSESACNVEYLMEDKDFYKPMKRQDYEKLIEPELQRIAAQIEWLKNDLVEKQIDLNNIAVEIIGGGSRIPIFQSVVKSLFNNREPSRTLDASTCIARGCAMMAAMKSPLFKVAHYDLEESNYYPVRATWNFINGASSSPNMEIEGDKQSSVMFGQGCPLPSTKSLNEKRHDGIKISLDYENAPEGFEKHLKTIIVPPTKPTEPEFSVKIKISLDHNNILHLEETELIEEYTVEEKVPIKKEPQKDEKKEEKKEGEAPSPTVVQPEGISPTTVPEEQFEIKKKKKSRHTNVKCDVSEFHRFTVKQIQDLALFEFNMAESDRLYLETIERQNELEASLFTWRDKLEGSHKQFFDAVSAKNLTELLDKISQWVDSLDGNEVSKSQYVQRLEAIQQIVDPILFREKQYDELPSALKYLGEQIQFFEKWTMNKEPQYEHISNEDRDQVGNQVGELQNWQISAENTLKNAKHDANPPFLMEDIKQKYEELINFCKPIVNQPKPAPATPPPAPAASANTNPAGESAPNPPTNNTEAPKEKMDVQ